MTGLPLNNLELFDAMSCDPADLVDKGNVSAIDKAKWPERLRELFDINLAYNRRLGMDDEQAAKDAAERVVLVAAYAGGRGIYLPNSDSLRRAVRDAQIHALQGRDIEWLSRHFKLTPAQIYAIIAEQTRLVRDRIQGKLF